MAERRIVEKTGRGVVCFISNYSWLDGLSFPGMRERYLEAFDTIRIDCLNGDKYKTGKVTPDGSPDPSIFSTPGDPVGIQVGTAIATLVRKQDHAPTGRIAFRHLWGQAKREELIETAEAESDVLYESVEPILPLGLPFAPMTVSKDWFDWPALPVLFPTSFPGVKTSRDSFLVDTDLDRLKVRIDDYFNPDLTHDEIARRYPGAMKNTSVNNAHKIRNVILEHSGPSDSGFIRYTYRPFDNRWLYREVDSGLLDRPRPDYRPHVFEGNLWLSSAQHLRKGAEEPQTCFTQEMASLHLIERGSNMFPVWLREDGLEAASIGRRPNLSEAAQGYLRRVGASVEDLFHYVLATLHDPAYRKANAGALRMEWPRIPLPGLAERRCERRCGNFSPIRLRGAANSRACWIPTLKRSGRNAGSFEIGYGRHRRSYHGTRRPDAWADDFDVTAGWGHYGAGEAVMPGGGRAVERAYTKEERDALGDARSVLGEKAFDVYLNERALWRCVPAAVWNYKLGGYQVLKKWLSYRERNILDRPLKPEEVQHFMHTARRIAGILTLTKGAHS